MGLTLQGSHTEDYNERHYFFFEERTLVQESIHLDEQLTSTFNDRLDITLGLEYKFRFALAGKTRPTELTAPRKIILMGHFLKTLAQIT
jgi:hypothetical protein